MILNAHEKMIAKRYLVPVKGERFIFVVAGFSVGAVALGVAALIIVMSVMNGFRAELFDKIVGLNGHAIVQGYDGRLANWEQIADAARKTPGVQSATPLIEQPLMASANGRVEGVLVRGNTLEDIRTNPILNGKVIAGDLKTIVPGSGRVAIGARLAETLGAYPGSEISLISPDGRSTPVGTVPRIVTYTVGAIFEVGIFEYDKAFVIMPMQDAQTLLLLGDGVGMVEVQVDDPDKVAETLAPLQPLVRGKGIVVDWKQMNSALFEALEVERIAMFVVLCIIILVAAFNIASSLIMLVRAKTRDIAILRTMGASRRSLLKIFMTVGLSIGLIGIITGSILGAVFLFFRQQVVNVIQLVTGQNLWDPSVRFLTELPSRTDPFEVVAIVAVTLVLTYVATLFPARNAANTDPVQVLRYE
ncbi:lipoprotein-releasing ABC transporter permease subunit [Sphingomonas sp. NSE70-1]|uniref:Lipoprotein-releasing ABC transporter permease subunit n=1 Tax=Sphingomonas caseinilyticus TaxID=2908205 RepID=A0ABT0RRJ4_9SPHN|nr:lipoprotein-releasing ABC transporter permease subunit [Sphingomonas caseinilyticus]MCL6697448.1 lipoprotein-releasing ABC transporter permease subunit [Sphingomonas caseinilyticus]